MSNAEMLSALIAERDYLQKLSDSLKLTIAIECMERDALREEIAKMRAQEPIGSLVCDS